jgi:hypothetical protein
MDVYAASLTFCVGVAEDVLVPLFLKNRLSSATARSTKIAFD